MQKSTWAKRINGLSSLIILSHFKAKLCRCPLYKQTGSQSTWLLFHHSSWLTFLLCLDYFDRWTVRLTMARISICIFNLRQMWVWFSISASRIHIRELKWSNSLPTSSRKASLIKTDRVISIMIERTNYTRMSSSKTLHSSHTWLRHLSMYTSMLKEQGIMRRHPLGFMQVSSWNMCGLMVDTEKNLCSLASRDPIYS